MALGDKVAIKKRTFFQLSSKTDEWTESPLRWEKEYRETIACGKCLGPRAGHPFQPIPQYVMRSPVAPFCLVMNTIPCIISESLADVLEPYLSDVAWGPVYLERDDIICQLPYRSYHVRKERCIIGNRSPFARHRLCDCGSIIECNHWAKEAIVESSLDDRLVYQNTMGQLIIDSLLAFRLRLEERFPLLDLFPIKTIEKPMDGDILPGDPGWQGVLIERPIEVPDMSTPFAKKWAY